MDYDDDLEDRSFLEESIPSYKKKARKVLLVVLTIVLTLVLILIIYVLVGLKRGNHDYTYNRYQCEIHEKSFNPNSTMFQGKLNCSANQTHYINNR